jgi:starch phosphorylase
MANLIIKLIHAVAEVVNNDTEVAGRLKVVFFPNADSTNGQKLYPAADISEQITTAGRERAGTGNITCAMNGALTVGTFNGTNLAISGVVGAENVFLFGKTAEEVYNMKVSGYSPMTLYQENPDLKDAVDLVSSGLFSRNDINLFKPFIDSLICRDEHMALADYQSYIQTQERAGMLFKDQKTWTRMSILTVAGMGIFSSDRAVREYNEKIWHAAPLEIDNNGS